jgi:hypothetical protein
MQGRCGQKLSAETISSRAAGVPGFMLFALTVLKLGVCGSNPDIKQAIVFSDLFTGLKTACVANP